MMEVPLLSMGRTHQTRKRSLMREKPGERVICSRNISARKMRDKTHQ